MYKHHSKPYTQEISFMEPEDPFTVQKSPKHCMNLQNNPLNSTEGKFYAIFRLNVSCVPIK